MRRNSGFLAGVEVVLRVERRRCDGTRTRSLESIRARLGEHVDLPAVVAAELGAVGVRLDAELADHLHAERRAGGAARRPVGEVVLQRAVEQVDVRTVVLAVDAHAEAMGDDRSAVARRIRQHARLQERQVGEVAAVERQHLDGLRVDQVAQLAGLRVDRSRASNYGDFLIDAAHGHDERHGRCPGHAHLQSLANDGLKSGEFRAQVVGAGRAAPRTRTGRPRPDTAVRTRPVSGCRSVRFDPGTTAPDASSTAPVNVAVVCAEADPMPNVRTNPPDMMPTRLNPDQISMSPRLPCRTWFSAHADGREPQNR